MKPDKKRFLVLFSETDEGGDASIALIDELDHPLFSSTGINGDIIYWWLRDLVSIVEFLGVEVHYGMYNDN